MRAKEEPQEAFDSRYRVDHESGCWEWTGTIRRNRGGYGGVKLGGKIYRAHRLSYELHVGDIPEGMMVCHCCDNPPCVNPAHLFLGTHKDNMADMTSKRRRHGQKNPAAKLRDVDVNNIKAILKYCYRSGAELARIYGVTETAINHIKHGKSWA